MQHSIAHVSSINWKFDASAAFWLNQIFHYYNARKYIFPCSFFIFFLPFSAKSINHFEEYFVTNNGFPVNIILLK